MVSKHTYVLTASLGALSRSSILVFRSWHGRRATLRRPCSPAAPRAAPKAALATAAAKTPRLLTLLLPARSLGRQWSLMLLLLQAPALSWVLVERPVAMTQRCATLVHLLSQQPQVLGPNQLMAERFVSMTLVASRS